MAGVVLETLSTRKLTILVLSLFFGLIGFFLLGGLIAPAPYSTIVSTPILCVDKLHNVHQKKPFIPRGHGQCPYVNDLNDPVIESEKIDANQIVFSQWLPLPRDDRQLEMSRWFQTMHTVIDIKVEYEKKNPMPEDRMAALMMDTTLYVRDSTDNETNWKEYATSKVERSMDCSITEEEKNAPGGFYDCELLPFFELGSVHYDFYLINIRIPVISKMMFNKDIGKISDLQFITIFQNGGFTKVWFSLKTVLFPLTLSALIWFWNRIVQLSRPANLLERTLFSLGIILSIMNFPLEWITLWADAPVMLLINDIREGAFYSMLMSFWLIFTGEHMMDQIERNKLSAYWKHLTAVIIGCLALFIFDMCERGVQLSNPFFSIWASTAGTHLALAFIIMAGIAACSYFLFLSYMIFRVFRNISAKSTSLPQMSNIRRKFYSGLIFRFKFLMMTTLLCAALTVIFFIISQVSEGSWKWGDDGMALEYSSAFLTGVYGMWNMYTIALLCLYAPSHKVTATAGVLEDKTDTNVFCLTGTADQDELISTEREPGWNEGGRGTAHPGSERCLGAELHDLQDHRGLILLSLEMEKSELPV